MLTMNARTAVLAMSTALLAATLPAQERRSEPRAGTASGTPAAKPERPPFPAVVAPTKDWFSQAEFDKAVSGLVPLVELRSGLEFAKPPRVRVANEDSWAAVVKHQIPDARDPHLTIATTLGLFLSADEGAVLSPVAAFKFLEARRNTEAKRRIGPASSTIVHELVHILQEQHFGLKTRLINAETATDKWVARALVEGYAVFVEGRIVEADFDSPGHTRMLRAMHWRSKRLHYARGLDFFTKLPNDAARHAAMQQPPGLAEFTRIAMSKARTEPEPAAKKR